MCCPRRAGKDHSWMTVCFVNFTAAIGSRSVSTALVFEITYGMDTGVSLLLRRTSVLSLLPTSTRL